MYLNLGLGVGAPASVIRPGKGPDGLANDAGRGRRSGPDPGLA
jgi:hypothetical protein